MSGNPFRRVERTPLPDDDREHPGDTPAPTNARSKKKKRVQIQTPPRSPEEIPRRLSAGRVSPPPPPPPAAGSDDDEDSDSTATADSELEQAYLNTRRNSGSLPAPPAVAGAGAPYNPFARTLATTEASFGPQQSKARQESGGKDGGNLARPAGAKPAMDVDMFKNILMTGSPAPSPAVSTPSQRPQDSSSGTDTSSVSRHSVFDHTLDVHAESPRTSFDQIESGSDDSDVDEQSNLMNSEGRLDDMAPPAPPKPGHGTVSTPRGPQTVSFADFDDSFSSASGRSPAPARMPPANTNVGDISRPPMMSRSASDLNKPLPHTPLGGRVASESPALNSVERDSPRSQPSPWTMVVTEDSTPPKKAAPPRPTSRRTGQSGGSHGRPTSFSNTTDASAGDEPPLPRNSADDASKTSVPPPPPSRKTKPLPRLQKPAEVPAPLSTETTPMPPPPPRRMASKAGNSANRTPSTASRTSQTRTDPHAATTQAAPTPPPPRRGAASKRTSTDGPQDPSTWTRRGSGISFDSDRSASMSSLKRAVRSGESEEGPMSPPGESAASTDILADMTAFQAEIDALRAKAEK